MCAIPNFSPNQHVYVSSDLSNSKTAPEPLNGLEDQIVKEGAKHHLQVYVVACQADFDSNTTKPAIPLVNDVVSAWQGNANFDRNNFLVIAWVRQASDPTHGSVAANGGSTLQGYGLTSDRFSSPDGPVLRDIRQFMPNNPQGEFVNIVKLANQDIDDSIQAKIDEKARQVQDEKDRIAHEKFMAALPGRLLEGGSIIAFIAAAVFSTLRYRRKKRSANELIALWQEKFDHANKSWLDLKEAYFDFLKDQGTDWKSKFKGKTLVAYTTAVAQFGDLTVRLKVAQSRLEQAQKASKCIFPLTKGFDTAVALLSTSEVTVTGDSLPMEMRDLFGSEVSTNKYMPEDLLQEMSELFTGCNAALSGIVKSFDGARQNKDEIEAEVTAIEGLKQSLTANELTFDPYQKRYDQINADRQAFLAILAADPMEAFEDSQSVKTDADALSAALNRAIEIKLTLPAVQSEIDKATKHAADVRATTIDYKFPELTPTMALSARFTLTEEGGNPDPVIATATQQLASSKAALLAGKLDDAVKSRDDATATAQSAAELVDTVLKAKAHVEETVPKVRAALTKLQSEIPAGTQDISALKGDFLEKNFPGQVANLDFANKVSDVTESELAKVRAAYYDQRYLASSANVDSAGSDVQKGRDGIVEIHQRLDELTRLREHSRTTVASAQQLADALQNKLGINEFTTAAAIDQAYASLVPNLAAQKADVDKDVTDWPAAASAADKLLSDLQSVDASIDQQKADYARAQATVAKAVSAISSAADAVDNRDTRDQARKQLAQSKQSLASVQASIAKPKSDWAVIARQAQSTTDSANSAKQQAEQDHSAANAARSAISSAESAISSADTYYGEGVTASLGSARSQLSSAQSSLSSKNYEQAASSARRAASSASSAASSARSEVASIIAAREAARRAEEAREAAERQRQADAAAAASQSSYGGGGGGGGDYGGGGGGGGNY